MSLLSRCIAASLSLIALDLHARTADPAGTSPSASTLDTVQVRADDAVEKTEKKVHLISGASNVIDLRNTVGRQLSMADVFTMHPGINVQSSGNEGSKISIRGSGINRGPGAHASGIAFSIDGLPLTGPGGTPYELLEPQWLSRIDVFRGANGLELGALALGGAIDYISRSGRDTPGLQLDLGTGSHGFAKQALSWGGADDEHDYLLALANTHYDGHQDHAAGKGRGIMANLGWQLRPDLHTRLLLRYRQTAHQTPGRLTREQIRHDPQSPNPANLAIDAQRPQPGSHWIGSMTHWQIDDDASLQAGLVHHRYPMDLNESLYRQQLDYENLNSTLDYQRQHRLFGWPSQTGIGLRVTHDLSANVRESRRFDGNGYPAGTTTRHFRHHGTDASVHVSNRLNLSSRLDLHTGLALLHTRRDVRVTWPANDDGLRRSDWHLAPRIGFTFQQDAKHQWFGNLSRSIEPAHPWSMIWGSPLYFDTDAGPSSGRQRAPVPMLQQHANTLELGMRGTDPRSHWELTLYQSHLRGELLSVELHPVPNLFVAENNASPTVHRGIEAALHSTLWQRGQTQLSLRQAWTFSDFRYRNDGRFGRNTLPGLPRHAYQAELLADFGNGLSAGVNTDIASSMPVDYANSFHSDSRVLFGARAAFEAPSQRWQLWIELRNLGNRRYAASVTPGFDDAGKDVARSTPGEGRSVYAGLRWLLG